MRHILRLAAASAALLAFAVPAYAAVTIHTAAFISNPVASTGFENDSAPHFNSPLLSGGVSITYVWPSAPSGTCCVLSGVPDFSGQKSWYADSNQGYTDIKLAAGGSFDQIQFLAGSGVYPDQDMVLNYSLLLGGSVVDSGIAGHLPNFVRNPAVTYGFSGTSFDEVRLWNPSSVNPTNDVLGLDDIAIGISAAVPEPATWALMIGGFGLAGAALRRKSLRPSPSFA